MLKELTSLDLSILKIIIVQHCPIHFTFPPFHIISLIVTTITQLLITF